VASAALIVTNPGDLAMTVMNQRTSERILLPRVNSDAFWETVRDYYAHEDSRCWKFLAMFALHTTAGMSVEKIGYAFGHPPGHVSRCLQIVKRELRARFQPPCDDPRAEEDDALTTEIHTALTD
jgi:hypothetical protein